MLPLEAVPNVSEGRDPAVIEAIAAAFGSSARLLDTHVDPDHHRSVFTLTGTDDGLMAALLAGIARACELIDLRRHDGVHPRVGVVDVVPVVAVDRDDLDRASATALALAELVGKELGLPVFLYGAIGAGRSPAYFRRGGLGELQRRITAGELAPVAGPETIDPATGAVLVGARRPLIAFNVDLATNDVEIAREIAAAVRESGGGLPGVRALGLHLPGSGRVQVSMNLEDWETSAPHQVVSRIEELATARGVAVACSELVGLIPAGAVSAAAGAALHIDGLDPSRTLELRLLGED
jgi:glutamate formiminotransferase